MAYTLGIPLLILIDDRLLPEGLVNPSHIVYGALIYTLAESEVTLSSTIANAIRIFADRVKQSLNDK